MKKKKGNKSKHHGTYYNGLRFDDIEFLSEMKSIKVVEVRLYENKKYVSGIQFFYDYKGQIVTPGLHCVADIELIGDESKWKDYKNELIVEKMLKLDNDEYINQLEISSGVIIDKILLKTNKGKVISAGGKGGNTKVYHSKENEQFIGFKGSLATNNIKHDVWNTIHDLSGVFGKRDFDLIEEKKENTYEVHEELNMSLEIFA